MRDRRLRIVGAAALAACLGLLVHSGWAQQPAGTEQEILRQIKEDVFEERWENVLEGCNELIKKYPKSSSLARTMYYRARALQNVPGHESEALVAYGEFIDKFPGEKVLREDALISRMSLAKSMYLNGKKEAIRVLLDGLDEKGYPKIYAAIQLSYLEHIPGRTRALPILKECAEKEDDGEVRNECTLAILRIGGTPPFPPNASEAAPGTTSTPPSKSTAGTSTAGEPKLIRLQVRDKATGKITVAVNLPIAFAEALLTSLKDVDQGQVIQELKNRGIDINNLWKSLRTLGKQTLVEIETEDAYIKVWLE